MSETYTPRVGDKVRATLGDAEVAGRIVEVSSKGLSSEVQVDLGVESWAMLNTSDGWMFERVVSVPSKFGAVIRRADGVVFVLASRGSYDAWYGGSDKCWARTERTTAGGFTILFDGVDE